MLFIRNYFAWIVVFFVQDAAWSSQGINSAPERTKRGPRSAGKHPCAYSVARSCARRGPRRGTGEAQEVPGQVQKVPEGPRRGPGRTPWMLQGTLGEARGGPGGKGVLRGHQGPPPESLRRPLLAKKTSKNNGNINISKNEGKKNTVFLNLLRPLK